MTRLRSPPPIEGPTSTATALAIAIETAIAFAIAFVFALPLSSVSHAQAPRLNDFELAALREVDRIAELRQAEVFIQPGRREATGFSFYGNGNRGPDDVKCERVVAASLIHRQGERGQLVTGVCTAEAKRVRAAGNWAKSVLETVIGSVGSAMNPEKVKAMGWEWKKRTLADGSEAFSFPIVMVGHGVGWIHTVIVVNPGGTRAAVVQADVMQLCDLDSQKPQPAATPLCGNTTKTLTDIAVAVARLP